MQYISHSVSDTYEFARKIADRCTGGEIIVLNGDLGAGKTTFTKGLALAFGIHNPVTSPTFTIMKRYEGRLKLYHFDLYRIEEEDELEELGFDEYLGEEGAVCVIEWNKFSDLKDPIVIDVERIGENERNFSVREGQE